MLAVIPPSVAHDLTMSAFVSHAAHHPPLLALYVACAAGAIEIVCHVASAILGWKRRREAEQAR